MHEEAYGYVKRHATAEPITVVEFGSLDINGTVRDLFPNADYVGIDLQDGPGVDIVADAAVWQPESPVDVVVCCEVLEHAQEWRAVVRNAHRCLREGGKFIMTAAGPGRPPHSAVDGGPLRPGEYYHNIGPAELCNAMNIFSWMEIDTWGQDVRVMGRK